MSGPLPDAVLRYADHDEAVIDLHLPDDSAGRTTDWLVVLLHGGFWRAEWDRRHTRPMARALAEAGCTVATPEYRRVGAGGGWPVTGEDVRTAVTRLPELLGSLGIRTATPVVTGHSAGGQLALWLATTGIEVQRVVALAPVCDLREAIRLDLGSGATRALLAGGDPDPADPMVLYGQRPGFEVVLVHGDADDAVPLSLSRGFVRRHPWAELREVTADHMALVEPSSGAWPTVLAALTHPG